MFSSSNLSDKIKHFYHFDRKKLCVSAPRRFNFSYLELRLKKEEQQFKD